MQNDLLGCLSLLRDELGKIPVSGMENVKRFAMCGNLLDSIISAVQAAQTEDDKGGADHAGTAETNK